MQTSKASERAPGRRRPILIPVLVVLALAAMIAHMAAAYLFGRGDASGWPVYTFLALWVVPASILCLGAVLIGDFRRMSWGRRFSFLGLELCIALSYVYILVDGQGMAAELGMRAAISSSIGTEGLQSWAVRVIASQGDKLDKEADGIVSLVDHNGRYSDVVPNAIRRLRPSAIRVGKQSDGQKYVAARWGSGWLGFGWAVYVGSRTFTPTIREGKHRWRSGVYTFHAG